MWGILSRAIFASSSFPLPTTPPNPSSLFLPLRLLEFALLVFAGIFFALHYTHLTADFPNHSPWMDWSKYTDEGWYGDAAIRHFQRGHWYVPGDFNPAAALPVWPLAEAMIFRFTGVSLVAARALTVTVFGGILLASYLLLWRWQPHRQILPVQLSLPFHAGDTVRAPTLGPALAVLLLAVSPFCFVFTRLAILEPMLVFLTLLALHAATSAPRALQAHHHAGTTLRDYLPALALGLLLPLLVLTKTTALFLFPSIAFLLFASAGFRLRPFLRAAIPAALLAATLWSAYFFLLVRPRFLKDYSYLFSANGYTGITWPTALSVLRDTLLGGLWIDNLLYPLALVLILVCLCRIGHLRRQPLPAALILWAGGYAAFLAYHNNLQPRYYFVVAVPIILLVAAVLGPIVLWFRSPVFRGLFFARPVLALASTLLLLVATIRPAWQTLHYVRHPEYTLVNAARGIAAIVGADRTHPPLLLSISGSDISLITGLPSICDDFGTLDLPDRVNRYRPGWYAAWNAIDDDKMDSITPLFHIERVAAFPAMDDPARNLLILYRLDPTVVTAPNARRRNSTPKPLQTRVGQQPSTNQLVH